MNVKKSILLLYSILMIACCINAWAAELVDHGLYDGLVKKYVNDGVVNYRGFNEDQAILDEYLKILEKTEVGALSRNEQFAFYINAYNAWTIKLILSGYPEIDSIKDLATWPDSPWKKKICRIGGDVITLDDIEHNILRPTFKDPRVHFAVNCASKGCPPLRSEAFTGSRLNEQLDDSTKMFINNPANNRLEGRKLYVSKIFKWFSDDFNNDIVGFFLKYAEGNLKNNLETTKKKIKIKYLDYDWSLNGS